MVVKRQHSYVKVMSSCEIASKRIQGHLEAYFKIKNSGEQNKIHYLYEGRIEKSVPLDHHLSSLVMPNCDPRDIFFYPTLTPMIDSYYIVLINV